MNSKNTQIKHPYRQAKMALDKLEAILCSRNHDLSKNLDIAKQGIAKLKSMGDPRAEELESRYNSFLEDYIRGGI